MIQSRIENQEWLKIHCPAEDTKNLVAALAEESMDLNVRARGTMKKIVGIINRSTLALDRAGDVGDEVRVNRAYDEFAEGMDLLAEIFPNYVQ